MMAMLLSHEQRMLADSAREFLANRSPVAALRVLRDAGFETGFDRGLWRAFAEMGFTGVLMPEALGGLGLGQVEAGIVLAEIGRNLAASPFLTTAVGVVGALASASEALQQAWLPRIAAGEAVAAVALEEAARHRPYRVALSAERRGGGFLLTGEKRFVVHGHVADLVIVSARTSGNFDDRNGITLFVLEHGVEGIAIETERTVDSGFAARLRFEGAVVPADAVLGEIDAGRAPLDRMLAALRVGAAAELAGLGGRAMEITLGYLGERRQFGQPIGSFQALQHRAAHLHAEMETARAAVLKAQQLLDAEDPAAPRAALVAKGMAGLASALAVQEGVQMHGGIGMTDEYDIGFYMKRQRVLDELFGSADYHADQLARLAGY
jgi:alkylation response protein AidB-like acyl-CoA dehydrogenase